jgi:hypothetical protein
VPPRCWSVKESLSHAGWRGSCAPTGAFQTASQRRLRRCLSYLVPRANSRFFRVRFISFDEPPACANTGYAPASHIITNCVRKSQGGGARAPASLAILSSGGYNWKPLQCVARAAAHNPKGGRRGGRYVAVQLGVRGAVSAAYRRGLTDTVLDLRHIGACAPRGALESVWDRNRPRKTTPIASGFGAAAAARATRS